METTEKQESQKTIVAFVAGLLIGGLLVWVFSSSPADAPVDQEGDGVTTEENNDTSSNDDVEDTTNTTEDATDSSDTTSDAARTVSVADQDAGTSVSITNLAFPTEAGWVAVRDYDNGVQGKILGAARYNTADGLIPSAVTLQRATLAGKTYIVTFHNENGDRKFDTVTDKVIADVSDTFVAK